MRGIQTSGVAGFNCTFQAYLPHSVLVKLLITQSHFNTYLNIFTKIHDHESKYLLSLFMFVYNSKKCFLECDIWKGAYKPYTTFV